MYLDFIELSGSRPCPAEPGKMIITGKPGRTLEDVLPYLACLPNVIGFNPETSILTLRRQPGFITIFPGKIHITQVRDVDEGLELLDALKDAINAVWERRHDLIAGSKPTNSMRPLDIYAHLPKTNCGDCGEANCLAFAYLLFMRKRTIDECLPLQNMEIYSNHKDALEALF
jgi:ArsR family metal-binding transcriptional regulator